MIEVLQFIFSSFWIWLGTVVLLGVAGQSMAVILLAFFGRRAA